VGTELINVDMFCSFAASLLVAQTAVRPVPMGKGAHRNREAVKPLV